MKRNVAVLLCLLVLAGGITFAQLFIRTGMALPKALTAEGITDWFLENREYFEAVKEQILLFETDQPNFQFLFHRYGFFPSPIQMRAPIFGNVYDYSIVKKRENEPLYHALHAFQKAMHKMPFNHISVYKTGAGTATDYRIEFYNKQTAESIPGILFYISYTNIINYYNPRMWENMADGWYLLVTYGPL